MPEPFLPDPDDDQAATRAARNLAFCAEIIELGMQALRDTAQDMRDERDNPPAQPGPDLATRFARLSRCVRQTMLLEAHIADARRSIVTKTIRLEQDRAFAAALAPTFARTAAQRATTEAPRADTPERAEQLEREHFPMPKSEAEIPSILANISREIGIDLEDRELLANILPLRRPKPAFVGEPAPD